MICCIPNSRGRMRRMIHNVDDVDNRQQQLQHFCLDLSSIMVTLFTFLILQHLVSVVAATSSIQHDDAIGGGGEYGNSFPYLYAKRHNYSASYPVIEYMTSDDDDHDASNDMMEQPQQPSQSNSKNNIPYFLNTATGTYRIVEFYIHWCNTCKQLTKQYIQLGQYLQDYIIRHQNTYTTTTTSANITLEVYAISCAPHRNICRALQTDHHPSFRLYAPDDTEGISISHTQLVPSIILQKLGILSSTTTIDSNDNIDDSWYRKQQIQLLNKSDKNAMIDWLWDNGRTLLGMQPQPKSTTSLSSFRTKYLLKRTKNELRDDIHTSFDYMMRYHIYNTVVATGTPTVESLSTEQAIILQDFLHLFIKTIPNTYTTLRQLLQSLIDHFDYIQHSESYMVAILNEYPPPSFHRTMNNGTTLNHHQQQQLQQQHIWSTSCSYGDVDIGYTCGLWLLLHTITIGVVEYNRNVVFHHHRFATEYVAKIIRDMIQTYLTCDICRQNFVTSYDNCAYQRCRKLDNRISNKEDDWIQLPLWLLDTHNGVNVRLLYEYGQRNNILVSTTDRDSVIWPLPKDCLKCYTTNNNNVRNDTIMYKFLKMEYSHDMDTMPDQYQEEIGKDMEQNDTMHISSPESKLPTRSTSTNIGKIKVWQDLVSSAIATIRFHSGGIRTLNQRKASMYQYFLSTLIDDIYGIHHSLQSPLSVTQIAALFDWYQLLRKSLPTSWYEIHALIDEVVNNWRYVKESKDYLLAIIGEYHMNDTNDSWSMSSLLSKHRYDETVLLMEMLYIVTIGVVQRNKYTASAYSERLATGYVAKIIQQYLEQFSNRKECRLDVIESMKYVCSQHDNCENLIPFPGAEKDWIQLPMYIFEVHNVLLLEQSMKKGFSSGQRWPSPTTECSKCWINDDKWDIDIVYKYILLIYGQEDSDIRIGIQEELFGPSIGEMRTTIRQDVLRMLSIFQSNL